ncbi:MAG TPA: hypothetical protein V6D25_17605 [Leptolyngbyaceae cyanobacterium]
MNKLTLAKLRKIAKGKGYIVQFEAGCYKIFQKVAEFNSLSDAQSYLSWLIPPCSPHSSISPVPPAPPEKPDPKYNLTIVWERCLEHLPIISVRALIGHMCHLASFDGKSASIYCKSTWYEKIKTDLPKLNAAFQNAFGRDIAITLLKTTGLPTASPTAPVSQTTTPALPTPASTPPAPSPRTPQPTPPVPKPSNKLQVPLLTAGKYKIRVLDHIIRQGYPELDGKNYIDVLKTVQMDQLLDSYTLSVGMKLSIMIEFNFDMHWLLNFQVVSLAIQSLKDGHCLLVVLQPISRLTSADHYLGIQFHDIT